MKLEEKVKIARSCYYNMFRSLVEEWPREVLGDLIGKRYKDSFILINAYPNLTSIRRPTEAFWGNGTARKRLRKLDKAINSSGNLGYPIIGQYHIHPYKTEEATQNGLSKKDKDFFLDEMKELNRDYSIQLILSVYSKEYKTKHKIGEHIILYPKKLRVILKDDKIHCYDISISAYKLSLDNKTQELEVGIFKNNIPSFLHN